VSSAGLAAERSHAGLQFGLPIEVDGRIDLHHAVVGGNDHGRAGWQPLGDQPDHQIDLGEFERPRLRIRAANVPGHIQVAVVGVHERPGTGRPR
jgi:hypothetical protein